MALLEDSGLECLGGDSSVIVAEMSCLFPSICTTMQNSLYTVQVSGLVQATSFFIFRPALGELLVDFVIPHVGYKKFFIGGICEKLPQRSTRTGKLQALFIRAHRTGCEQGQKLREP